VRGLRWVKEPKLQGLRFIFSSYGDKGVKNAFQRGRRARPDARERFTMHCQFADQASNRVRAKIGIGKSRIAANWKRWIESRGNAKAGLREPMANDRFQVQFAANASHIRLRGKRAMPGKNLEAVIPTILDHQKPSFMAEGVEAANGAAWAFCDCVIHQIPLPTSRCWLWRVRESVVPHAR